MQGPDGNVQTERAEPADQLGAAAQLMGYPVAMSAIGLTLATQAMATWLSAMASAAEASQRLLQKDADEAAAAAPRADKAVRTVMSGAADAAQSAARKGEGVAQAVAKADRVIRGMTGKSALATPKKARAAKPSQVNGLRQPLAMSRPAEPDDLKAIAGVGPKLEQVLNGCGIWTYAQVAAWKAEEIAWVEDMIGGQGRIGRDGWVAQAAVLSGLKA